MAFLRRAAFTALLAAAVASSAAVGQPPGYPAGPPPIRVPQPPAQTSASAGVALPPQAMCGAAADGLSGRRFTTPTAIRRTRGRSAAL